MCLIFRSFSFDTACPHFVNCSHHPEIQYRTRLSSDLAWKWLKLGVAVPSRGLSSSRTSVSMATFAFVSAGAVALSPQTRAPLSSRRGTRYASARRRSAMPAMCVTTDATQSSEEEVLDEKAMRAAEIHEVLSGLEEFKSRIVEDATRLAKKVRGKSRARSYRESRDRLRVLTVMNRATRTAPKKQLESALAEHPDILKIDGHIAKLQEELKQLGDR